MYDVGIRLTYLLMIITIIVMIAPKKMNPPKIATAIMPSKLYFALASVLCAALLGVGLKLASTFCCWLLSTCCWCCWCAPD